MINREATALFESRAFKKAKEQIDNIAMSFLRGSQFDSHEARMTLLSELKDQLSRCSSSERKKLKGYEPTVARVFQGEQRSNYHSWLAEAFRMV